MTLVTTTPPVMVSMHNPAWDHEHHLQMSSGSLSVVIPLVVILIGVLLLVTVVLTRIYWYRRRVQSYTYAQLTADLSMEQA